MANVSREEVFTQRKINCKCPLANRFKDLLNINQKLQLSFVGRALPVG